MFRTLLCLLLTTAPALAQGGPAPALDEVLAGIQKFYAEAQDLKAQFTQHYTFVIHDKTRTSSGIVFFKKPGKMRWDYKQPVPKVFVADGETLWVYEPEDNQVFKRKLADAQLPVALTFMSGEGKLSETFDATLLPAGKDGAIVVQLIPKKSEGHYRSLRLEVDPATFAVRASTVVDPQGNTNRLVFSDVKTNAGLPDAGFKFTPPAGVRVLTGPAQ